MKMKKLVSLSALLFLGVSQIGMHETGEHRFLVRLALNDFPTQMKKIHALDLDMAGVDLNAKTVDLVVTEDEKAKLDTLGFQPVQVRSMVSKAAPDTQFQTPAKVEAALKAYAQAYPTLAQLQSAGKSLEGRDIWVMKITKNVSQANPNKPRIFFNGMHHAREVMSVEVPLDTIDTLLTQYGKDPKVTHWVDSNEIWVLPMFNVDGNNKVWTSDNMWRKNVRDGTGVDINRNYPFQWNSCNGSSSRPSAQDYHGPSGGSEVETHVMMDLVKRIRPTFSISYHSYSEIVIYPYGCSGQHTPTQEIVESIGQSLGKKIVTDDGRGTYKAGTAPELLYSVDGGDIDWMYHEFQVIPYVIEVNSSAQGFQPGFAKWRESTVKRVKPAWQFLLDRLDGSSIHGLVKNAAGAAIANASIKLVRTSSGTAFSQDYLVAADGSFNIVVPSGQYQVTISAPTMAASAFSVNVAATRVELPVSLRH